MTGPEDVKGRYFLGKTIFRPLLRIAAVQQPEGQDREDGDEDKEHPQPSPWRKRVCRVHDLGYLPSRLGRPVLLDRMLDRDR